MATECHLLILVVMICALNECAWMKALKWER